MRETLSGLLNDQHKEVRQAALAGLASLQIPLDVGPICQMLRDPDPAIQRQAKAILIQVSDVQTMPYLVDLLQDAAEDVRQGAVDVLHTVQDSAPIRALLHALRDKEWWVQVRAFEALRTAGKSQLLHAVLALLKDAEAYIRSSAIEMLKQDRRAFNHVVQTLGDPDAGVRARAVEALVALEDKRTVPVFLRLLHETPEVGTRVIPVLAKLGDRQAIPPLLECLQGANQALRQAALRALVTLTDAAHAAQVFKVVMAVRDSADTALKEVANGTAATLIGKFGAAAVGGGTQSANTSTTIVPRQAPLHDPLSTGVSGMPGAVPHDPVAIVTEDHDTARYIDVDTLEPDTRLVHRYRVIRRVGQGGFGAVVLVEDTVLGEEIVLKFLLGAAQGEHAPQWAGDHGYAGWTGHGHETTAIHRT